MEDDCGEKLSGKEKLVNFIKDAVYEEIRQIKQDHERLRLEYQALKENCNVLAQEQLELVNLVMAHHGFITLFQKKQNKLKSKVLLDAIKEDKNNYCSSRTEDSNLGTPTLDEQMVHVMQKIMGNCRERISGLKSSEATTERPSSGNNKLLFGENFVDRLASKTKSDQSPASLSVTDSVGTTVKLKRKKKPYKILVSKFKCDCDSKRTPEDEKKRGEMSCQTEKTSPYPTRTSKLRCDKTRAERKTEDFTSAKSKSACSSSGIPPAGFMAVAAKRVQTNPDGAGGNETVLLDTPEKPDGQNPISPSPKKENKRMETETVSRLFGLLDELKALSTAAKGKKTMSVKREESEIEEMVVNPQREPVYENLGQWKHH
jgi:hypothetical protein